jgi:hypothetical protein
VKVQGEERQERSVVDRSGDDWLLVTRCVIKTAKFGVSYDLDSTRSHISLSFMDYLMFSFFVSRADKRGIPEALKSHIYYRLNLTSL